MNKISFTVVITTYNRARLVQRAIQSVQDQDWPNVEIVVVDDASTDATSEIITVQYPRVRYIRQEVNQGHCPNRNRGIQEANNPWVVILDDDDTLLLHALREIATHIISFKEAVIYPVLQFAHSNGHIPKPFMVVQLEHYINSCLKGDFVPVINVRRFLNGGLAYPAIRIGGEHLLWWEIAKRYGIPTWALQVAEVHTDAPFRLSSPCNQITRAQEYAKLQEFTIERFGTVLATKFPNFYAKKRLAAATYWLLDGDSQAARVHLNYALKTRLSPYAMALWILSFLPRGIARWLFLAYRRMTRP